MNEECLSNYSGGSLRSSESFENTQLEKQCGGVVNTDKVTNDIISKLYKEDENGEAVETGSNMSIFSKNFLRENES